MAYLLIAGYFRIDHLLASDYPKHFLTYSSQILICFVFCIMKMFGKHLRSGTVRYKSEEQLLAEVPLVSATPGRSANKDSHKMENRSTVHCSDLCCWNWFNFNKNPTIKSKAPSPVNNAMKCNAMQ